MKLRLHSPRSLRAAILTLVGVIALAASHSLSAQDLPYSSGSTGADGALVIPTSVSARIRMAMVFDSVRQRIVLFGGNNGNYPANNYLNDTWEWDGLSWTLKTPATLPGARETPALAFDSARQRVVLFGGSNATYSPNETWEWDGTNWTLKAPVNSPSSRNAHAMAYDTARQRVVLFGGSKDPSLLNDTWEWDGTNWTQKTPASSPAARATHAMAYDSVRQRVVLFGGNTNFNANIAFNVNDTWEWDGTNWTQKSPANSPPARYYATMAFDAMRQRTVLFGGSVSGGYSNDTWEWDGTDWTQKSPATSPPARSNHSLAYDSTRQRIVMFGGNNGTSSYLSDTWEWDGTNWTYKAGNSFLFDMTGRANGIWNYTSITVPNGVTVSFKKNAANTPVVWLASDNVRIDGVVDVSGTIATGTDAPETVGRGGPGGFDGGIGATRFDVSGSYSGQPGQGPGGGLPGTTQNERGNNGSYRGTYGNAYLQPLIGGSGGGGGASWYADVQNRHYNGAAGGGGGGAILIASSRDIIVNGAIRAKGGLGEPNFPADGGTGSGGAVRLVADRVTGSGSVDVDGSGRIRIEGFYRSLIGNGNSVPASGAAPTETFAPAASGSLIVASIAGQNVVQPPTGSLTTPDVVFTQAGPITVTVTATGIPNGTPVRLRLAHSAGVITLPANGAPAITLASGSATFTTTVAAGTGTIQAFADYTVP